MLVLNTSAHTSFLPTTAEVVTFQTSHSPNKTLILEHSAKPQIRSSVNVIERNVSVNDCHWVVLETVGKQDLFS